MRELTACELEAVSGGATATEYIILISQLSATSTATRHDTTKNSIGNIR